MATFYQKLHQIQKNVLFNLAVKKSIVIKIFNFQLSTLMSAVHFSISRIKQIAAQIQSSAVLPAAGSNVHAVLRGVADSWLCRPVYTGGRSGIFSWLDAPLRTIYNKELN